MSKPKRYYWMKLKDSFMTSDVIDYFMSQPDGANYVVLYQMLCLKTINTGGRLSRQIGELIIPYDEEKIQRDCKWFSIDTVRVALKLYQAVGLIYEDVDGTLVLTDHKNLVGSESDSTVRVRNYRERQKEIPEALHGNGNVTPISLQSAQNVTTEIDIRDRDKRLEKDIREEEETKGNKAPADEPPSPTPAPDSKTKPMKAIDFGSLSPRMISAVEKWLQYKKERRESYKPTGLQAMISQIENNVALYGEDAVIGLIAECMASNWRGIIFDRLKNQPQAQRSQSGFETSNPFLEMLNERRGEE